MNYELTLLSSKNASILMSAYSFNEASCLELLLGLKLTPTNVKWKAYISAIAKDIERMVDLLYHSKKP